MERDNIFSFLRGIVLTGDMKSTISPIELYGHNLISRAQLLSQTVSFKTYLETNWRGTNQKLIPQIFSELESNLPLGFKRLSGLRGPGTFSYRVYPSALEEQEELIRQILDRARQDKDSPRTEQEQEFFRKKLLRIKVKGQLVPISLEDGYTELQNKTKMQISIFNQLGTVLSEEDVAESVVERLVPYLLGQKGDFENFNMFMQYALKTARNELITQQRGKLDRLNIYGEMIASESGTNLTGAQGIDVMRMSLSRLSPELRGILRLRLMGISVGLIEELTGRGYQSITHKVFRSLNDINPSRNKRRPPKPFDGQVAVLEYKQLRAKTLDALGRLPTYHDITLAYRNGECRFTPSAYSYHFGQKNWHRAQQQIEDLLGS